MERKFKFETSAEIHGFESHLGIDPSILNVEDSNCKASLEMTCTINFAENGIESIWWSVNKLEITTVLEGFTDELDSQLLESLEGEREDLGRVQRITYKMDSFEDWSINIHTEKQVQCFDLVEVYWQFKDIDIYC